MTIISNIVDIRHTSIDQSFSSYSMMKRSMPFIVTVLKVPVTLIFFYFGRKVKSSMDTNSKKQLNFLRLSMGFDRKKIKI